MSSPAPAPKPSASWVLANLSPTKNLRHDLPAAVVVFLVALPLCLGIALASGAPLFAGLVTGIVGGMVVSVFSGSALAVSGPAAGLTAIVLQALADLGSWEAFLLAVVLAGAMQLLLGVARAGIVAYFFPNTVIKGMLAAIGLILILKQIPHAIGWDKDYEGDESFWQPDGRNTFSEIAVALEHVNYGAVTIAAVGLAILFVFEKYPRLKLKWLPGPLLVVVAAIGLNALFGLVVPALVNTGELLVSLPTPSEGGILSAVTLPDFSAFATPAIYKVAVTVALIASIETLLSIEAVDKQDPFARRSDTNKELRAQGIGNIVAGLLGGLPMTAVIVRSSANVQAGGRTWVSAFVHGALLLVCVALIPGVLNLIPYAALAAVLLHVGYKLSPPQLYQQMFRQGWNEFIPFIVTVVAILLTDLLIGIGVGMATGVFFILRANLATAYYMSEHEVHEEQHPEGKRMHIDIVLSENVTFLNKASVNRALHEIPEGAVLTIDGSRSLYIDRDVQEIIHEFAATAHHRGIDVKLIDIPELGAKSWQLHRRINTLQRNGVRQHVG